MPPPVLSTPDTCGRETHKRVKGPPLGAGRRSWLVGRTAQSVTIGRRVWSAGSCAIEAHKKKKGRPARSIFRFSPSIIRERSKKENEHAVRTHVRTARTHAGCVWRKNVACVLRARDAVPKKCRSDGLAVTCASLRASIVAVPPRRCPPPFLIRVFFLPRRRSFATIRPVCVAGARPEMSVETSSRVMHDEVRFRWRALRAPAYKSQKHARCIARVHVCRRRSQEERRGERVSGIDTTRLSNAPIRGLLERPRIIRAIALSFIRPFEFSAVQMRRRTRVIFAWMSRMSRGGCSRRPHAAPSVVCARGWK